MSELPSDHPIWDAWEQVKSAYPGPCANWEAEPPLIWAHAINDMTAEQVASGIRNLVKFDNNGFPPSAAQFRELCLTNFDWEKQCHKEFVSPLAIEDKGTKERRIEHGKQEIAKLLGMFD